MAPPNGGGLNSTHIYGTQVPVEEPSTASEADSCTAANHRVGMGKRRNQRLRNADAESNFREPTQPSVSHALKALGGESAMLSRRYFSGGKSEEFALAVNDAKICNSTTVC
jgi:hypothetical protein